MTTPQAMLWGYIIGAVVTLVIVVMTEKKP